MTRAIVILALFTASVVVASVLLNIAKPPHGCVSAGHVVILGCR